KSDLERAKRLESENAMSSEERDRRVAFEKESAAQVAAVEAALRAAELNLEFTRVTSPIDGRVGRAIVTVGNLVSSGPGEATLLQARAVGTDLDKRYVYVAGAGGTIEYRAVQLGPMIDGLRVVRSGLKPGELVVINGLQRVRPGAHIEPVKESMSLSS